MKLRNCSAILLLASYIASGLALNPVILIPGDGGSQLEGKLNKTKTVSYVCASKSDWFDLWLNIEEMIPLAISCWVDNMKLIYDPKTHTTRNNDGVQIRVPGFGNTSTVEYLDPSRRSFSVYFAKVAKKLASLGYVRGTNLHGAPYDFRKAANEHEDYFKKLKALIEKTYSDNGNKPVILICHSMGSPMALYLLNRQSQAWKDKHIKAMITMAGVWAGTVRAMKVFAVGDNLGAYIVSSNSLKIEQRSNPSLAWLMPSDKFWKSDEVLVESTNFNLTVNDYATFYLQYGHPEATMMRDDVKNLVRDLSPPGVQVFCLHGSDVPTTEKLQYHMFPSSTPVIKKGNGDGTVNLRSLLACTNWQKQQKQEVHHKVFSKIDHLDILRSEAPTEYVKSIVQSLNGLKTTKELVDPIPQIELIP